MVLTVILCSFLFLFICLAFLGLLKKVQRAIDLKMRRKILLVIFCGLYIFTLLTLNHLEVSQLIDWKIMLGILLVLNVLDWHSTVLCVKKYGVEREAQAHLRSMLEEGIKPFSLFKLLLGSILIFIIFYANQGHFPFQAAINFTFLVVVLRNYIIFFTGEVEGREK